MAKKLSTTYLPQSLAQQGVEAFTAREFASLFGMQAQRAYEVLHWLESRGFVKHVAKGLYVVVGVGRGEILGQPFFLGTRLVEPSYISFWSALHFYGWTEQAPRSILVANTRISKRWRVENYHFQLIRLRPSRFFGYELARQGDLEFPVADPPKAIIDSLYLPVYAGGVEEVSRALEEALDSVSISTLVSYALQMNVRSLCSRLGFLLERAGVEAPALQEATSRVYVRLDPSGPRRGKYDRRWNVIDNIGGG